jgi:hypothetical protein
MDARKFAVGDRVLLRLDGYSNESSADVYTIARALPAMANVWQYRVKRVGDGQERAVNEQQLATVGLEAMAKRSMAEAQQALQRSRNARASARVQVTMQRPEQKRR